MMTADGATKAEVADLFDRYVTYLDERQYQDWLDLFTEDARYVMLLREDYVKDTNMLAIGEGKRELAGRIEVGQGVERDPRTHLLTAVILEKSGTGTRGAANFALLRHGAVASQAVIIWTSCAATARSGSSDAFASSTTR